MPDTVDTHNTHNTNNPVVMIIVTIVAGAIIGIGAWIGTSIQGVSNQLGRIEERLGAVQAKVDSRDEIFNRMQDQNSRVDERMKSLEDRVNKLRGLR